MLPSIQETLYNKTQGIQRVYEYNMDLLLWGKMMGSYVHDWYIALLAILGALPSLQLLVTNDVHRLLKDSFNDFIILAGERGSRRGKIGERKIGEWERWKKGERRRGKTGEREREDRRAGEGHHESSREEGKQNRMEGRQESGREGKCDDKR